MDLQDLILSGGKGMKCDLMVYKTVERTRFTKEDVVETDDILMLAESGSFWFDDGGGRTVISPLEAVCFQKGRRYHREVIEPVCVHLFRYRSDAPIFESSKVTFRDRERIRSTLQLLHMSEQDTFGDDFSIKKSLFGDMITQYLLENAQRAQYRSQQDTIVSAVLDYIQGNFHKKLNLAALAEQNYLSYVQFSRRFKSTVGVSPQDYVTNLRLKKAKVLLSETDLSVGQIAANCGFRSEYYFSNFFKKHNNLSPSEFRLMVKSKV